MRGFERISLASLSVCLVVAAAAAAMQSQGRGAPGEWRYYGGNKAFTRYSPLDQINRDNVKNLKIAWRRPAVSDELTQAFPDVRVNNYLRATPIFIDGMLFTQNAHGLVVAFDGESGKTVWQQELFARTREEANGASTRGVDYWRGGSGNADKRIFAIRGEYLYALNAETGKPVAGFGDQGRASLHFDETEQPLAGRFNDSTGPLVIGNVVVVTGNTAGAGDTGTMKKEAAPEDVRGFDAQSGKLLWTFHVVPRPGEFGNDTWGNDSWKIAGDLGAWNPMTADEELGYVYVPLTAPTASAYGVWRPGDNLFADSLVALDAKTGKRVWHFQTVHHNLWEWENVGPAMLADLTVDGRRIKAVVQPNKNGFLFVLDRTNGKPVWPIEERPVPQSNVPGEKTSPTQPFPTKPPPFDRQGVTDADLIDYTPELKQRAREIAKDFVIGPMFTPPTITTEEPGHQSRDADAARLVGRGELEHRRIRSGDRHLLRDVGNSSRAVEPRDQEDDEPGSDDGVRERRHVPRHRRAADHQGAVRPHHRDRSQQGHRGVDGGQRRRPAISPAAQGAQPAAARRAEPAGGCPDQDAAVPRRGEQRRQRHAADRLGLGQEVPGLRQGDRQGALGNRAALGHDRRPDDLHAERQAVHRRPDRLAERARGVRGAGAAVRSLRAPVELNRRSGDQEIKRLFRVPVLRRRFDGRRYAPRGLNGTRENESVLDC